MFKEIKKANKICIAVKPLKYKTRENKSLKKILENFAVSEVKQM